MLEFDWCPVCFKVVKVARGSDQRICWHGKLGIKPLRLQYKSSLEIMGKEKVGKPFRAVTLAEVVEIHEKKW